MAATVSLDKTTRPQGLSGELLHDLVDHLQESILQVRRARTAEHWETLKEFWKMYKLGNAATERLEMRQKMCKILMYACSGPGYDVNKPGAMINWKPSDWDKLMKYLSEVVGTTDPFRNETLKHLSFSCAANRTLANYRITLETDIRHQREVVSISQDEQSKIKDEIADYSASLEEFDEDVCEMFGTIMSTLFVAGDEGLFLKPPATMANLLGEKPFLFGWVIAKIESVIQLCNEQRFDGQEATLWKLGYRRPEADQAIVERQPPQPKMSPPTVQSPSPSVQQTSRSPSLRRTPPTGQSPSTSEGDFLRRHKPVVLGSVQRSVPRANVSSPPRVDRKRNTEIFDEHGRVLKRRPWTDGQTTAIIAGLRKYGHCRNKWALIKDEYPHLFEYRTSTMIKDRFRTLNKRGEIAESVLAEMGEQPENDYSE